MYYKVTNKECPIYKTLAAQREQELQYKQENEKLLASEIKYPFIKFSGFPDQAAQRVPIPVGFYFTADDIDLKVWKEDTKRRGLYFPNKRTAAGRKMEKFLNTLKHGSAFKMLNLLGIDFVGTFRCPYLENVDGTLLIRLDDQHRPKDENFIEITMKEFVEILETNQ